MLRIFQAKPSYNHVLFPEVRKAIGTEHLHLLIHCATNFCQVRFQYKKYQEDNPKEKTVNPIALKESKNRWYLLAFEEGKQLVKTYGLDRISELVMTGKTFKSGEAENWQPKFESAFGITTGETSKPDNVVLSFEVEQGRYVKALRLHHSQETVLENEKEIRFSLRVFITFDFVMELLSYGDKMVVISPASLVNEIKEIYASALNKYD